MRSLAAVTLALVGVALLESCAESIGGDWYAEKAAAKSGNGGYAIYRGRFFRRIQVAENVDEFTFSSGCVVYRKAAHVGAACGDRAPVTVTADRWAENGVPTDLSLSPLGVAW